MLDFRYKAYIADSIHYYAEGKAFQSRWLDSFERQQTDTRTGDEVATDVISSLGLKVR